MQRVVYCECFFLKQKAAYELWRGLVGSEMCKRESGNRLQIKRKQFEKVIDELEVI